MHGTGGVLLEEPEAAHKFPTAALVRLLRVLADETRLRILQLLHRHGSLNVRTLCRHLKHNQPAVSHHLAILRRQGLVRCRRSGKHNYYELDLEAFERRLDELTGGQGRLGLGPWEVRIRRH